MGATTNKRNEKRGREEDDRSVLINSVEISVIDVHEQWANLMLGYVPIIPYWMPNVRAKTMGNRAGILYPTENGVTYCTDYDIREGNLKTLSEDGTMQLSKTTREKIRRRIHRDERFYMESIRRAIENASIALFMNFISDDLYNEENGLEYTVFPTMSIGTAMQEYFYLIKVWAYYTPEEVRKKVMDGIYPKEFK